MWREKITHFSSLLFSSSCSPFVSDQHDDHVRVGMLPSVLQPRSQMVERVPPRDVVDEQRASGAAVIGAGNRAERLLAGL